MSHPRIVLVVAATLVLAVLPASAGPTGVGTAASDDLATTPGVTPQQTTADTELRSGGTFWQGRQLAVDASNTEADALAVWRVTDDGQLNQQVATAAIDNGTAIVDTSALRGRYVLRAGEAPVYVQDGAAYTANPPDGTQVTRAASTFQVVEQTMSTRWSDPSVYPGQQTTLTIDSNRDSAVVAVSADGLSFVNLTTLVPETAYADSYDARKNDSTLLIEIGRSTSLQLDTTVLEPGDRDLTIDVIDTTARTTASLTVNQHGDAHIKTLERHEQVGDVIDVDVACGHCFLVVGGTGQGILDVVELSDSNGDGNVSLRINTRYAGMGRAQADFPNGVRAYTSPTDGVSRYSSSATLERTSEALRTSTASLSNLRKELGLAGNGRTNPVSPTTLRLTVATSDYLLPRWDYGDRPPRGSTLVVHDEVDVETVELAPRSLDGVTAMAAPPERGDVPSASELRAMVGPRDRVALGDRLVFRVDVSGVYGYLAAHGTSLETLADNRAEGIELRLRKRGGTETATPDGLPLRRTAAQVVADPDNDALYLVLETGGAAGTRLKAGEFRASFTLEGVSAREDAYSASVAPDGYPYLAAGATDSESATATLTDPVGEITTPADGSGPNMTATGSLAVSGTTSIAPGATVSVVANATDYAWETSATAAVTASGNWSVELGLAEAPGRSFAVTLRRDDTTLDSMTYTVYPPAENSTGNGSSSGGGSGGASGGNTGGSRAAAAAGGPTIPILGIQLPALSGLMDLAVPVGGGIGALAVVGLSWKFVIKRILL